MRIEELVVNIIFDAGKGTTPVSSREGTVGKPFGDLPKPSRSGYAFEGWYAVQADGQRTLLSDELTYNGVMNDGDLHIAAVFTRIRTVRVSIMGGGHRPDIRGERLDIADFVALADQIYGMKEV